MNKFAHYFSQFSFKFHVDSKLSGREFCIYETLNKDKNLLLINHCREKKIVFVKLTPLIKPHIIIKLEKVHDHGEFDEDLGTVSKNILITMINTIYHELICFN